MKLKTMYDQVTHDIICCSDIHGHNCPYCSHSENGKPHERCMEELAIAALRLIEELHIGKEGLKELFRGQCDCCRWEETAKCASCIYDLDAWNTHEDNWEWDESMEESCLS